MYAHRLRPPESGGSRVPAVSADFVKYGNRRQAMSVSYTIKRLYDVAFAILYQKRLDWHDRWSREKLDKHQQSRLSSLVSYAVRHSPFYKKHYGHIDDGK